MPTPAAAAAVAVGLPRYGSADLFACHLPKKRLERACSDDLQQVRLISDLAPTANPIGPPVSLTALPGRVSVRCVLPFLRHGFCSLD